MKPKPREKKIVQPIAMADIERLRAMIRQTRCGSGYFLVGPTATGKTSIAHLLAVSCGFGVLSADSMAVYRHMDVGTAKPVMEQRRNVDYYGLDLAEPSKEFSVGDYLRDVNSLCPKKTLIVAGGTGLYVKALTEGIEPLPEVDQERRRFWNEFHREYGVDGLRRELKKRSPSTLSHLDDPSNPRRLIRALELVEVGAEPPAGKWRGADACSEGRQAGNVLVGLWTDVEERKRRIERRVEQMYSQGLIEETKQIIKDFGGFSDTAGKAIGYREAVECIAGRLSIDDAKARTAVRTRQLAKRQMTWFRRQLRVEWVNASRGRSEREIAAEVAQKWLEYGPARMEFR